MKEENKIVETYGRKGPWSVPEDYFDSMRREVMSKLPEYPEVPKPQPLSTWKRLKPYVYLAAMFAGIWCMMQVFHHISGGSRLNLDNPPEHIALLMGDMDNEDMYMLPSSLSDSELIDEVSDSYDNIEDFEADFGYQLSPKYDKIEL